MLNLMKTDMRNIKLWEYIILLPSLILLSFLASLRFHSPILYADFLFNSGAYDYFNRS